MKPIRKAVFPVAGLGTRFLPATKAVPKEMLPVVDRPLIQHVVDEAREAGIEHFIFVTGRNKGVIEDHFDRQFELEHTLTERQRRADLEALAQAPPGPGTARSCAGASRSARRCRSVSVCSSSNWRSKWSSMTPLLRPVTKMKCSMPASRASSTTCWISGRSTTGSINFGIALVAGRNRVPSPATGKTALRTDCMTID